MKPYRKKKLVLNNWRKADAEKNAMLTPNVWYGNFALVSDLQKIAKKIRESGLPKRIRKVISRKLL